MLTRRQRDLLAVIVRWMDDYGIAPSVEEMCSEMAVASKATVFRLLDGLESRGFIRRLPRRARAIEVLLPVPDGAGEDVSGEYSVQCGADGAIKGIARNGQLYLVPAVGADRRELDRIAKLLNNEGRH